MSKLDLPRWIAIAALALGCAKSTETEPLAEAPQETAPVDLGPITTDDALSRARGVDPGVTRYPDWDVLGYHAFYRAGAPGAPPILILVDEDEVIRITSQADLEALARRAGLGVGTAVLNHKLLYELFFTWVQPQTQTPVDLLDPTTDPLFGEYAIESGCVKREELHAPTLELTGSGALYRYWIYRVRERDCRRYDVMITTGGRILYTTSPSGVEPTAPPADARPGPLTTIGARARLSGYLVRQGLAPGSFELEREPDLDMPNAWAFDASPSGVRSLRDEGPVYFVGADQIVEVDGPEDLEALTSWLEVGQRPLNHRLFYSLYFRFVYDEPSVRIGGVAPPEFPKQLDTRCVADPEVSTPSLSIDASGARYQHWIYRLRMQDCVRFDVTVEPDGAFWKRLAYFGDL